MSTEYENRGTPFRDAVQHGLRVFPVRARAKEPAVRWTEYKEREPSEEEIASWDASNSNVGVICGAEAGIAAFDIDSTTAQAAYEALELPLTPYVITAKGRHYYYKFPKGGLGNRVRVGGIELDVRGEGGYVVGAGSVHPSGAEYRWGLSPQDVPFAEVPQALLDLVTREAPARGSAGTVSVEVPERHGVERFLMQELASAAGAISGAEEGARNDTLFKRAVRLANHVAGAGADWAAYAEVLREAALASGLEEYAASATLDSAWKRGSTTPTAWLGIIRDYAYLAGQDLFFNLMSQTTLKRAGFNGKYGVAHGGEGTFSSFVLNNGFVTKVQDITYDPRLPGGCVEKNGTHLLNTYVPSCIQPIAGDATPFFEFLDFIVPDETEREHVLKLMAFTVRHPGIRIGHAMIMRSAVHGVGKSMLADIWGELVGRTNVRKTTSREIASAFQGWITRNTLLVCEELNLGQGLVTYNSLKDLITSDTASVNEKYIAERTWEVFSFLLFLTNRPAPMLIEKTDRRIFFVDTPAKKRSPEYYAGFVAWKNENMGVIRWALDQVDLSDFNP